MYNKDVIRASQSGKPQSHCTIKNLNNAYKSKYAETQT
jgi:hypothetical protein